MFITTIAAIVGIAGGIKAMSSGSGGSSPSGAQAQQLADPFSQYRAGLGQQYSDALQPGGNTNIESMPGFTQFNTGVMQPAMDASKKSAASSGMLYSGNEEQALQKTGQQGYYGFMTDYLNKLAQGSGAVNNPATAAGMGLTQGNQNQQGVMQGLGAVSQGISGLYGSGNPTGYQSGGAGTNYQGWDYSTPAAQPGQAPGGV